MSILNNTPVQAPVQVGFFLTKGFTLIAMASAVEVLRMANQLSGQVLYQWHTFSDDGEPVAASDDLKVSVDSAIPTTINLDNLIVCGG